MSTSLIKPETPKTIAEMQSLGEVFVKSRFFQDSQDAAQAIVKVMAGAELGFPPIASMTGVYIVKGKVSLSANLIAAAIKRSGRYTYRVRKLDDSGCVLEFFENGESIGKSSFTREDAQRAQLLGKETWRSFFRNMAFARALSNGAKWHCPDVFGGPVYTPEELGAETDGEGELINVTPREEKSVKPLALVPAAPESEGEPTRLRPEQVEQLEAAPIADPLPETPNTQPADDEEAARIEQEHSDLNTWIKAAWQQAGGSLAEFDIWANNKDLYNATLGWKRNILEKLNEKARKLQEEKKSEPKSNEPASELPAEGKARARKTSGQDGNEESKREKALVENNKQPGNQGEKLKGAVDDLCAEFWPNDKNEGYKACREKAVTITGTYWRNWDELSADDAAKVLAMFSRWNPADDKPKGKGKK